MFSDTYMLRVDGKSTVIEMPESIKIGNQVKLTAIFGQIIYLGPSYESLHSFTLQNNFRIAI